MAFVNASEPAIDAVTAATLPTVVAPEARREAGERDLKGLLEAYERSLILAALGTVGGRQRSAAELLRILPSTLHEKMKRLGIRPRRLQRVAVSAGCEISASLHWKGSMAPGGTLAVRGLNGSVRIEASDDDQIEVLAARRGARAVLSAIEVKVVEHQGGVTVCALCQELEPTASRRLERRVIHAAATVRVDLVARVPPGVHVTASTVNDDIVVVGLTSNVEAGTANGRVRFIPAPARAEERVEGATAAEAPAAGQPG